MKEYIIHYTIKIALTVEAEDENRAMMQADRDLIHLTGADFRENCELIKVQEATE